MLPCYVMLDLETTGGNAVHDRITEIAAVRVENGMEVDRWSTLVNPGVRIPPFIQNLTGISDAMVQDAPSFDEVAPRLMKMLDGAVFVAHNVRFDHGFVLNELARMDVALKVKTLCTVRLSRTLYPQHKGHGLDAIMQRHGLQTLSRHRAMGDVELVRAWLEIAARELGAEAVGEAANRLLQGSACIPPLLETPVSDIPDTPGVYLFYGEGALPLYIGKSVSLRTRVLAHFQSAAKVPREMRILQEIRRIEWRMTAGDLGALLLESRLVKKLQPVYNRQLRQQRLLVAWQLSLDPTSHPLVKLLHMDDVTPQDLGRMYGVYRSKRQATDALREIAATHGLCLRTLGLEAGKGACFASQIGKCRGVCAGREDGTRHFLRLQIALAEHKIKAWPYAGRIAIREHHEGSERTDIHVFDQWCHLATVNDEAELQEIPGGSDSLAFDLDTYRLLLKHIKPASGNRTNFFVLDAAQATARDVEVF